MENYPVRPETAYSLGKALEEVMAGQFCRWNPRLKMIGLRFSNVMDPSDYAAFPSFEADPSLRSWNLWAHIDALTGPKPLDWRLSTRPPVSTCSSSPTPTRSCPRLARTWPPGVFPGVEIRGELRGTQSLLSIDKARRVRGYSPRHSWRDHAAAAV